VTLKLFLIDNVELNHFYPLLTGKQIAVE